MKKLVTLCTVLALAFAASIMFTACSSDSGGPSAGLYRNENGSLVKVQSFSASSANNDYTAAIAYAKDHPASYTLYLDADVSVAGGTNTSTDATMLNVPGLTLRLEGIDANRTISLSSNGRLFTVALGSKLVLGDKITLKGKADNGLNSVLYIAPGGRAEMYNGTTITGNIAEGAAGGGVFVDGVFTMEGGSITGNTCNRGGGVNVNSGTFTMLDGTISGNEAGNGGGVYVNGTFNLLGGSITGNTANGPNDDGSNKDGGGGVCLNGNGQLIMTGGSITNNTAEKYGGGVMLYGSYQTFTMYRGTISGNTAKKASSGGGVYLNGANSFFYLNSPAVKASVTGNFSPAGTANQVVTDGGQISGSDSGNTSW